MQIKVDFVTIVKGPAAEEQAVLSHVCSTSERFLTRGGISDIELAVKAEVKARGQTIIREYRHLSGESRRRLEE